MIFPNLFGPLAALLMLFTPAHAPPPPPPHVACATLFPQGRINGVPIYGRFSCPDPR